MAEIPGDDPRALTEQERLNAACDWADYRSAYGIGKGEMSAAHQAFIAGWQARNAVAADEQETTKPRRIVCPWHGIPDCSPLLNGCSRVIEKHRAADEQEAADA